MTDRPRVAHDKAQSKSRFPQSVDRAHAMAEPLRTLEFFSGIGGLHYALRDTRIPHKVLKSYDVDDAAVKTYRHNMPDTPVSTQNISSLKAAELPRADCWLLSPPCQPYTRQGLQLQGRDSRAAAMQHIIDLLELDEANELRPTYLLLENVVGFESSGTRARIYAVLIAAGYCVREVWCSPAMIGVPNQRTRYFLLAAKGLELPTELPAPLARACLLDPHELAVACSADGGGSGGGGGGGGDDGRGADGGGDGGSGGGGGGSADGGGDGGGGGDDGGGGGGGGIAATSASRSVTGARAPLPTPRGEVDAEVQASCAPISDYLLPAEAPELSSLAVGEHVLERYGGVMDLVGRSSRRSCCFTKNYSRYVKGTGSIVCEGLGDVSGDAGEGGSSGGSTVGKGGGVEVGATTSTPPPLALCPSEKSLEALRPLKPRFFAPREIARLHGFPDSFTFPPDGSVGRKKQFELLGNSLSVQVVSALLEHVLFAGVEDSFAAV